MFNVFFVSFETLSSTLQFSKISIVSTLPTFKIYLKTSKIRIPPPHQQTLPHITGIKLIKHSSNLSPRFAIPPRNFGMVPKTVWCCTGLCFHSVVRHKFSSARATHTTVIDARALVPFLQRERNGTEWYRFVGWSESDERPAAALGQEDAALRMVVSETW